MNSSARVFLWGDQVGILNENVNGRISFVFNDQFLTKGLAISPFSLANKKGVFEFPELSSVKTFSGLPGVFADSLPDTFGNKVIEEYFRREGVVNAWLSPIQKLLYIGDRAMGALEYRPSILNKTIQDDQAIEIKSLVESARKLIEGDTSEAINEIMRVGSSAGGARAKALILINRELNRVKSGFAKPDSNDEHWLIKFDGIPSANTADNQAKPYNRIEYTYALLAKSLGVNMSEVDYVEGESGLFHFMTKRFDRTQDHQKIHMHSLGGLTHNDYNMPQAFSYDSLFRAIRKLNLPYDDIVQAFKLMVFNIVGRNQDDHVKNISFLMANDGTWRLAPAYDLTFSAGSGYTKQHQLTLNGKGDYFDIKDFDNIANMYDISNWKEIIEHTTDAFSNWSVLAKEYDVNQEKINHVASFLRLHLIPYPKSKPSDCGMG